MLNTTTNARTAAKTTIACAIAAALALSPAAAFATPMASARPARAAATRSAYIGAKKAKAIALRDAGLTEERCRYLDAKLDLDRDDGPAHYDVNFKAGDREYEYDIDAVTGQIMSREVEIDD